MPRLKSQENSSFGGVDSRSNPINLPASRFLLMRNWISRPDGHMELRDGYTVLGMTPVTADVPIHSAYPFQTLLGAVTGAVVTQTAITSTLTPGSYYVLLVKETAAGLTEMSSEFGPIVVDATHGFTVSSIPQDADAIAWRVYFGIGSGGEGTYVRKDYATVQAAGWAIVIDAGAGIIPNTVTIAIAPTPVDVALGATQQFTATVGNASNLSVTWAASAGSISGTGLLTAPGTPGTCTVTATSVADPTKSATASVNAVVVRSDAFAGSGALAAAWTPVQYDGLVNIAQFSGSFGPTGTPPGDTWAFRNDVAFRPDQRATVTLQSVPSDNCMIGVVVRANGVQAYLCRVGRQGGAAHRDIVVCLSGSAYVLWTDAILAGAGDVYNLSVVGTTITFKCNGVTLYTGTDAAISAGAPGIGVQMDTGSSARGLTWVGSEI